ncbi:hypothetical protein HZH68_003588 [Vespula germanica]|uniref:Uncharacterized protein n=1 Tax=Vespula germanica TaxID=30212 RepID=A0A834NPE3_VESGE|nr:hypothetical protein HZH68_003588 [Vespula germanica]
MLAKALEGDWSVNWKPPRVDSKKYFPRIRAFQKKNCFVKTHGDYVLSLDLSNCLGPLKSRRPICGQKDIACCRLRVEASAATAVEAATAAAAAAAAGTVVKWIPYSAL